MDSKKSIFWLILIIILVTFGIFWYLDKDKTELEEENIQTILVDSPTETSKEVTPEPSISDMQTAAANLAIPDYSEDL